MKLLLYIYINHTHTHNCIKSTNMTKNKSTQFRKQAINDEFESDFVFVLIFL